MTRWQRPVSRVPHNALFLAVLAGLCLLGAAPGVLLSARAQDTAADGSDFQDRYMLPQYEVVDTTHVETKALTLKEIIDRCIEGEQTKLSGHTDLTYTVNVRSIALWSDKKKEVRDEVWIGYEEDSGYSRGVRLDERLNKFKWKDDEWVVDDSKEDVEIRVGVEDDDSGSMFTRIPFFLEESSEFKFQLVDRTLLEDRVIFEIAFQPKSDFKPLPSGTVFVDTRNFRIVHEIFSFDGQNPFPMVLKDIRRVSRQWKQLPTGEWVVHQIAAEIGLRGYFGLVPNNVTVAVLIGDFVFDAGYDEHKFGKR